MEYNRTEQRRMEKLQEINADLLAALKECRKVLGIRDDFAPLGPAATLAPIIDVAIRKAERQT